jgi:hypothetical protein
MSKRRSVVDRIEPRFSLDSHLASPSSAVFPFAEYLPCQGSAPFGGSRRDEEFGIARATAMPEEIES